MDLSLWSREGWRPKPHGIEAIICLMPIFRVKAYHLSLDGARPRKFIFYNH
jgi:hypothetical protein